MCIDSLHGAFGRWRGHSGGDYRRVREDVQALENAGLRGHDESGLRADCEIVRVEARLALCGKRLTRGRCCRFGIGMATLTCATLASGRPLIQVAGGGCATQQIVTHYFVR
jgi:hypothetical protein